MCGFSQHVRACALRCPSPLVDSRDTLCCLVVALAGALAYASLRKDEAAEYANKFDAALMDVAGKAGVTDVPRISLPSAVTDVLKEQDSDLKNPNDMAATDYNSYLAAAVGGTLVFLLLLGPLTGIFDISGAVGDFAFSALIGGTAETKTVFYDPGANEEKKKRKNREKKGCWVTAWVRHRTEHKPLEAETALRKLWDSETEHTTEHACAVLAKLIDCRHLTLRDFARCTLVKDIQKALQKQQLKPARSGRKKPTKNVGGRCRAPSKPAAERQHSLTATGGSFRALLRGLLLLSCCAMPNAGLAPAVKTGPSSFATIATVSVPNIMRTASSGTLAPPTPPLECALEVRFPYVI